MEEIRKKPNKVNGGDRKIKLVHCKTEWVKLAPESIYLFSSFITNLAIPDVITVKNFDKNCPLPQNNQIGK
jgi:hypothetical protein